MSSITKRVPRPDTRIFGVPRLWVKASYKLEANIAGLEERKTAELRGTLFILRKKLRRALTSGGCYLPLFSI